MNQNLAFAVYCTCHAFCHCKTNQPTSKCNINFLYILLTSKQCEFVKVPRTVVWIYLIREIMRVHCTKMKTHRSCALIWLKLWTSLACSVHSSIVKMTTAVAPWLSTLKWCYCLLWSIVNVTSTESSSLPSECTDPSVMVFSPCSEDASWGCVSASGERAGSPPSCSGSGSWISKP